MSNRRDVGGGECSKPRVVVGMPVHNGGDTLAAAVQSMLTQEGVELTGVVSDNWSTDGTASVVAELAAGDPQLHAFRPDHLLTPTDSFLFVLDQARTHDPDFFTWLAADDVLLDGYLERAVAQLRREPGAEFVTADAEFVSAVSSERLSVRCIAPGLSSTTAARRLLTYACLSRWNEIYSVFRASALDQLSLLEGDFGTDVTLIWRLLLRGPAARLDMVGTRYSIRSDGPQDKVARLRYKLGRARSGRPPNWHGLWCDLYRVAADAPTSTIRRQARAVLVVAAFHPNWLRKFTEEALRRAIYSTRRRS